MKQNLNFIKQVHTGTKRNYLQRVTEADKAECAAISKQFDREYFDGDRKYGYGGYRYDGRWKSVAEAMIAHYGLKAGDRILDIGCAKGFLLHEFKTAMPDLEIAGIDVSEYAITNAMDSVKPFLRFGDAMQLPYADKNFDFIVSINSLHNLQLPGLFQALQEIQRVGRGDKYIIMDSYRNEREKVNLMYWQLTCECFFTPSEWTWIFQQTGYDGDWDFIYFE